MAEVRWSARAIEDLRQIHDFIARDSQQAADSVVDRLISATERLEHFPLSGRIVPELPETPYREVISVGHRILYRPEVHGVWVVAVIHGRRLLPEIR